MNALISRAAHPIADQPNLPMRVHRGASPADALARLRKFIDLPENNEEAWAMLEAGLGRWNWNSVSGKYILKTESPRSN
ncbi:MAG: hypothetical protein ABIR24_14110 [Verrucomicrobiota bacterium]